jgi:hypothetical protein
MCSSTVTIMAGGGALEQGVSVLSTSAVQILLGVRAASNLLARFTRGF